MAKKTNELECECGHIAGSPFTLRAHQKTHGGEKALDKAIEKATKVVKAVKKVVKKGK